MPRRQAFRTPAVPDADARGKAARSARCEARSARREARIVQARAARHGAMAAEAERRRCIAAEITKRIRLATKSARTAISEYTQSEGDFDKTRRAYLESEARYWSALSDDSRPRIAGADLQISMFDYIFTTQPTDTDRHTILSQYASLDMSMYTAGLHATTIAAQARLSQASRDLVTQEKATQAKVVAMYEACQSLQTMLTQFRTVLAASGNCQRTLERLAGAKVLAGLEGLDAGRLERLAGLTQAGLTQARTVLAAHAAAHAAHTTPTPAHN